MLANYHTHTWRCKHAEGTEREYVEQAIEAGIRILGFSDHTPYPFPDGHTSYFRMAVDQAEDYFRVTTDLQKEYAGQIEIHVGVEAEYYPAHFAALLELLRGYPCEYLIMGQHFTFNEDDGVYSGRPTADEAVLVQYVSQVLEGLGSGFYTYLAHPDLLNWQGSQAIYHREMRRLCRGVKALGIPLEINLLGLGDHRHYPAARFWEIAGEEKCPVVLGCDAHKPTALGEAHVEADARTLAARYGLEIMETVELKGIKA